ncbi:MAG: hypothetical protein QXK65_01650 [Candidatus Micrarchaeaceae archaeon]
MKKKISKSLVGLNDLENEVLEISEYMKAKQKLFDRISDYSREIIRLSAQAITYLHNGKQEPSKKALEEAQKLLRSKEFEDERFSYYTLQAQQEYAEASIFYAIKNSGKLPGSSAVGVSKEAYLLGLMDTVGELKREVLEELRRGNVDTAEYFFSAIRSIYDSTRSVRFAEAVLQGFRKKQDVARIQLENAGTEILYFRNSKKL